MKTLSVVLLGLVLIIYLSFRFSYARERYYDGPQNFPTSEVMVGIIGDSWVSGNKLDYLISDGLTRKGIQHKVISQGYPGAKTKKVYKDLLKSNLLGICDYLIIVAGVNDAIGQLGSGYYSYHTRLMIQAAFDNGVHPIVVMLPYFGIEETHKALNPLSRFRNYLSAYNNSCEIDNIQNYRNRLLKDLKEGFPYDVTLIYFDKSYKDHPELYLNPSHLNLFGNDELANLILSTIYFGEGVRKPFTILRLL